MGRSRPRQFCWRNLAMTGSRPDHCALAEALRYRVLEGPCVSDRVVRKAVVERTSGGQAIAASYDDLVRQIGESSHRVTNAQVERQVRRLLSKSSWPRRWGRASRVGGWRSRF